MNDRALATVSKIILSVPAERDGARAVHRGRNWWHRLWWKEMTGSGYCVDCMLLFTDGIKAALSVDPDQQGT